MVTIERKLWYAYQHIRKQLNADPDIRALKKIAHVQEGFMVIVEIRRIPSVDDIRDTDKTP